MATTKQHGPVPEEQTGNAAENTATDRGAGDIKEEAAELKGAADEVKEKAAEENGAADEAKEEAAGEKEADEVKEEAPEAGAEPEITEEAAEVKEEAAETVKETEAKEEPVEAGEAAAEVVEAPEVTEETAEAKEEAAETVKETEAKEESVESGEVAAEVEKAPEVKEEADAEQAPEPDAKQEVPEAAGETSAKEEAPEEKAEPKKPAPRTKKTGPAKEEADDEDARGESVDFSDEDAELAAQELDLGEDADEDKDHEHGPEDHEAREKNGAELADKTKPELVELFAALLAEKPIQNLRRDAEAIKVAFYKLHRADVDALRKAFVEAGGVTEDFQAPADADEVRLKELVGEYRQKRDLFLQSLEQDKEENLKTKLEIIEELKNLVNGNETLGQTFNAFRELQQRWRDTGPVPQNHVKDLWETYNHHVENFYSYIKINKELRDLDLKRNYEAKAALCEEAEALVLEPSIVTAFHKLQKLHDEWRETGPVANEFKEALWERFREASARINKQHQHYFDSIKEEQKKNLDLKAELCARAEELASFPYTTRKEWNKASDKLLEIQKVWKTIGFAPKKDNAKVYERFRIACDRFFEAKRTFYNQLKTEMEHNLQLKNEICEMAESMQESGEWKKTTDELIALQKRWREIGPVSRRHSDAVWKRFRAACDRFFERKSAHFSDVEGNYKENLDKKNALLAETEGRDFAGITFEEIKEFQRRWSEIGFVPIKQKDAIQRRYKEVVDRMFSTLRGGEQERSMNKFRNRVSNLKNTGDKRLRFERERLYNKVKQLEADIATLENNIGFFGNSPNAEAMVADVREKIERAKAEMAKTIEKIGLIDAEQE